MIDAASPEKRLAFDSAAERQLNQKRQVKLRTCADVYDHWRAYKRLYKKAPQDGIEFQIDYIDTGLGMSEEERAKAPIALALHGAPGSYHDFSLLINHLAKQRVRVIAPNFPEYIATVKTKVLFRHSADEKAAYLRDFLKAIDVKTIDLLVSHSSAIFPTLLILLNANNQALARQRAQREADEVQRLAKASKTRGAKAQKQPVSRVSSAPSVKVDSFSQIGNQLKDELTRKNGGNGGGGGDAKNLESESGANGTNSFVDCDSENECDDSEPPFVDAIDELVDDNNNQNNLAAAAGATKDNADDSAELVLNLKRLNLDEVVEGKLIRDNQTGEDQHDQQQGQPLDAGNVVSPTANSDKAPAVNKAAKRRRRHPQDVIVQFDEPIEIKAVALFNPAGHRLPKSMKPTWFKCGSVHVYQHRFGRSLFRKFGPAFLTVVGVPVRVDNMDNVMLSATVMRNSKCQRVVKQLEQLSEMKIPTLLVFSENDKLIEKEIFYEMTQFMRLDSKKFDVFNNDGDIELSQSMMDDWIRVMVFKAGGHYAYSNYAKTVNKAVSELLARVRPTSKETQSEGA